MNLRENRAKFKRSSKYSTPYLPFFFEESGIVDPLSPQKRLDCQETCYAVNCMLSELFWKTHQCT